MLISALCEYYDVLQKAGKVLPSGYSYARIHCLVSLTSDGQIDDIADWQIKSTVTPVKGKSKERASPRDICIFQRSQKPGIDANVIEHRPLYLFGLNLTDGELTPNDRTDKARKSHADFVTNNISFIEGIDSPVVNAYRSFIKNWQPVAETENPYLLGLGKLYSTVGFAFCLSGRPDLLLHENEQLKARWQKKIAETNADDAQTVQGQCSVSGELAHIARIHNKIQGVAGGLSTGTVLVCFKNAAECSYGADQSYNANISEEAMRKYTEALNALLKDHKRLIDDMTVIYWAMSPDERFSGLFDAALFGGGADTADAEETDRILHSILESAREGNLDGARLKAITVIDPSVDFYIVGLKANSSRAAVKFIYRKQFGEILMNIAQHQHDLQMREDAKPVKLWQIKQQLLSPKARNDKVDSALIAKLLEAILNGHPYPQYFLATIIRRVKTDQDEESNAYIKINELRVGLIKASLNRSARFAHQKEEFGLALDKENTNTAYLCGRLFAALERLQQDASGGSLNRTIRDAYFASASSKPALVFPKLVRLAQAHLGKAKYARYWNSVIGEIMGKLGWEFPDTFLLGDQGRFIIGYYQQFFSKNEKQDHQKEEN